MKMKIVYVALALGFFGGAPMMAHAANANQCKDPKTHKFVKCPTAASASSSATAAASVAKDASATTKCRDAKGRFTKCPTTKPKQCRDAKGKFTKCPA